MEVSRQNISREGGDGAKTQFYEDASEIHPGSRRLKGLSPPLRHEFLRAAFPAPSLAMSSKSSTKLKAGEDIEHCRQSDDLEAEERKPT